MNAVRFSITIVRLAVCAAIALILLSPGTGSALAANSGPEKFSYDPSTCKTDAHGKLYIALGRNVLAVPYPTVPALVGAFDSRSGIERLTPPDPTDHEGCPKNPRQLESYAFNYQYNEALAGKGGVKPPSIPHPRYIELFNYLRGGPASWPTQKWMGEDDEIHVSQLTCAHASVHEQLDNGLMACRVKSDVDFRTEDWAASYVASPNVYQTPFGEQFVVNCSPGLFSAAIGYCEVAYRLAPGVGLAYRFEPYRGPGAIPILLVIRFDRDLRAQIERSILKDYTWPEQPPHPKPN